MRRLVAAMLLLVGMALGQAALNQPLPVAEDVIIGKLPNGLTYYVRKNSEPKDRAELRLVVNAGSNQEDDDQKGLAHFLEHMLFKGTERFPGLEIINFLEKIGMRFGPDINAFTSFDETGYILKIPTTDPAVVQKAFDVLQDWAQSATLADADVKAESGVIVEEERTRERTASGRINKQLIELLASGSRYAERRPIGDMNIVRANPTEAIRRFYRDWYRPDLMAVVAVGDFDPKVVEEIIQKNFAGLKNPANPRPRQSYTIPAQSADTYKVLRDPEFPATQVSLYGLKPATPERTLGDVKNRIRGELFAAMMATRLDDLASGPNPPFVQAEAGRSGFVRTHDIEELSAQAREGQESVALEALVTELRRARLGFTQAELERAKVQLLARYQKNFNERNKRNSSDLADAYVEVFLSGAVPTSDQTDYELTQRFIGELTLGDVNAYAQAFLAGPKYVLAIRPEKAGLAPLSEADLQKIVAQAEAKPVQAYQEAISGAALLEKIPAPAAITKENKQPTYTELVLANGARVLYKKTDFKADEVLFRAYSPGGASLYSDEDYPEARILPAVVDQSGLGSLERNQLTRVLAGKQVAVSPFINEREEGMQGNSTAKDLETLFQLVYLYFTQPRADPAIFEKERQSRLEAAQNRALNPISALQDVLDEYRLPGTIRGHALSPEALQKLDRERGLAIYKERFSNAANFTFVFVGSFDEEKLKDFAQKYLGTLPSKNTKDTWKNVFPKVNYTKTEKNVYRGKDERGYAVVYYATPLEFSLKNSVVASALRNLLDIRTTEELREKLGGIYSAGVNINLVRDPYPEASALIQFSCDPKKAEELLGALFKVIEEVKTQGASEVNLGKVREQLKRAREEAQRTNGFWLARLVNFAQYPDLDPNDTQSYFSTVDSLTSQDLQQMAQTLFKNNYLKGVLYPEAMKP